ncbi:hypothetical protein Leryth_020502 [Lithospermum erythrorhizon]|nr:hypothetical protein Leryth_020502 [Lithospermum erythrorhizon]
MEVKREQTMHPPPPHPPPSGLTKRRPPLDLQNQPYYKIRAVLKDVRPHFLQVLRTPDFRNCEAASEIRQKLKVLLDLYKEMTAETINVEKVKSEPNLHKDKVLVDVPDEKPQSADVRVDGTYIVGGSAFGWNFITYPAIEITYYGRTKESFRALNTKSL